MDLEYIKTRMHKKRYRREHRGHVKQWWADGGDDKFRFDYPLTRNSYVLDLGGYKGQWASDLYSRYRCRISVFEPIASYADKIRERFSNNDDIEIFDFGLGESTRTETIYIRGAGSSAYGKKAEATDMKLVDVGEWFDERHVNHVDLVKINIEGGEFELLERMIKLDLVKRITALQIQFHNVALDSFDRMEAIKSGLEKTHEPTWQYKFVWENWVRKEGSV